jgi:predicted DNA-binding mobile mystery protein A
MRRSELTTLKYLRNYLVKKCGTVKPRRFAGQDLELCRRLDETLLGFRAARMAAKDEAQGSWLRAVRKATGVPVDVLAQRLGVKRGEVNRLEKVERESRIMLANLQRAAEALGCELVYALVPREGSLADLAATEREARNAARAMASEKELEKVAAVDEWIDVEAALRRHLRKELRAAGLRVR